MATSTLHPILRHIRRLAGAPVGAGCTDADLLERFVTRRDEAAFAALLERHGPLVWGVCRRLLHDPYQAEDAFQATFLVLLRRAGAIGRRARLAGWLYGVAYRVAVRARAQAARRQARERVLSEEPSVDTAEAAMRDLSAVVDEEVNRLPTKYREPVVLCYLQGKTNAEAAAQLGWPEGTVFGRLARARGCLRKRLERRGVALSAGALAAALTQQASAAAVPSGVLKATLHMAVSMATVPTAATAAVSPPVAALAEGVLRTMFLSKLKTLAALAAVALILTGSGLFAHQVLQPPTPPLQEEAVAAADKSKATKLDLTPASFPELHALIRPHDNEWRHLKVQWLTDVVAARKKAAAEDKPIIICYTGGAGYNEPLGVC